MSTESITHIIKSSVKFSNIVKLCLRCNSSAHNENANSKMNEEQSNHKSNRIDVEELEEDDASTHKDENEENSLQP